MSLSKIWNECLNETNTIYNNSPYKDLKLISKNYQKAKESLSRDELLKHWIKKKLSETNKSINYSESKLTIEQLKAMTPAELFENFIVQIE